MTWFTSHIAEGFQRPSSAMAAGRVPADLEADRTEILFEQISEAENVAEAIRTIQLHYGVSFITYHLARTAAGRLDAPFVRTTYSDGWVSRYLLNGYVRIDPVLREGFSRRLPFEWSEVDLGQSTDAFFADAAANGVGPHGYSIPIWDKAKRRALLSLNSDRNQDWWEGLVSRCRQEWAELAHLVHKAAIIELYGENDPFPLLSDREVQCLHWAALGKDQKDIAVILNLSEHTVRDYCKSARLKLGCATCAASATRAIHLGIIDPWPAEFPQKGGSI